jgi:hypothetical protein
MLIQLMLICAMVPERAVLAKIDYDGQHRQSSLNEFARGSANGRGIRVANDLLKIAVVILSSINAVMWKFYTESTFMAVIWAAIAIAFAVWTVRDIRYR